MKFIKIVMSVVFISGLLGVFSCSSPDDQQNTVIVNESDIVRKSIGVAGMTCVGCEVTLETNIAKIPGVVEVKASASDDKAIISFDSTKTDMATITSIIKDAGYEPFTNSEL